MLMPSVPSAGRCYCDGTPSRWIPACAGMTERSIMHLVIDGHGCDAEQLSDQERVRRFLDEFPDRIGMTKIAVPAVHLYHGPVPEDWGVSGFVIIAESHISVHTFPDRGVRQHRRLLVQGVRRRRGAGRCARLLLHGRRPLLGAGPGAGTPRPGDGQGGGGGRAGDRPAKSVGGVHSPTHVIPSGAQRSRGISQADPGIEQRSPRDTSTTPSASLSMTSHPKPRLRSTLTLAVLLKHIVYSREAGGTQPMPLWVR